MSRNRFRAILLAAGLGTRLRPITLNTPKCLVEVGGKPLLGRWLKKLEMAGCEAVLVNTHYLAEQVESYIQSWKSDVMSVETVHENELLGTAGTLLANQIFFAGRTGLLIHADNVMGEELDKLLDGHENRKPGCILTMLTFQTNSPSSCGIVEVDKDGIVRGFHEKIRRPPGDQANGALYAFGGELLETINEMEKQPSDFSLEVIPSLVGRIATYHTDEIYMDIGSPKALVKANELMVGA